MSFQHTTYVPHEGVVLLLLQPTCRLNRLVFPVMVRPSSVYYSCCFAFPSYHRTCDRGKPKWGVNGRCAIQKYICVNRTVSLPRERCQWPSTVRAMQNILCQTKIWFVPREDKVVNGRSGVKAMQHYSVSHANSLCREKGINDNQRSKKCKIFLCQTSIQFVAR